jgi:group I intron endonuclease
LAKVYQAVCLYNFSLAPPALWGLSYIDCNFLSGFLLTTSYSSDVKNFITEYGLNPVYVYEDLHSADTKKKLKLDTDGKSGVYLILNKTTSDFYIGSASTNRFYARFVNHLYYFIGSKILKLAVKKYGLSNFSFIVLELFPEVVNKENNKNLLDLEDFYLKSLLPNYNILTEAGNSFGYKHTEITRIKMRVNYSLERREKIGNLNKNKQLSPETIEKIRSSALNRKKAVYSEEALKNMKKKSIPVIVYNLDKTVYGEFPSIMEAAKNLKCGDKTIRKALNGEIKFLKRKWIVKLSTTN